MGALTVVTTVMLSPGLHSTVYMWIIKRTILQSYALKENMLTNARNICIKWLRIPKCTIQGIIGKVLVKHSGNIYNPTIKI